MKSEHDIHFETNFFAKKTLILKRGEYLIVAVDYFTKWLEAEPLFKFITSNISRFFKMSIMTRFGAPQSLTTNIGTQFLGYAVLRPRGRFKGKASLILC